MEFVADLHLHSKYSRAVSRDMILPVMAEWGKRKGIDILTTGDWTHPLWFREIRGQLEEAGEGVYKLKSETRNPKLETNPNNQKSKIQKQKEPVFLLTVEVSSIYSQGGKLRRIHNLIFAPSFEIAEKINKELARRGVNLMSDGRPIMGLSSRDLIELVLGVDKRALLIPCHAWTPWFSLYGSNSGFDSIEECFGDYSKYIYAVETGLSSDPAMNWKIAELSNRSILSFSDAHSPAKMGREATVFRIKNEELRMKNYQISYNDIAGAIKQAAGSNLEIGYTIEFYPEEGKYHYTGHRNCKVVQSPEQTAKNGTTCPVCGRNLTVGVEHRVQELAKEGGSIKYEIRNDENGVKWIHDANGKRPPYVSLVPLLEIIAEALSSTTSSQRVKDLYDQLTKSLGTEVAILLRTPISDIERHAGAHVAEGIKKVRERNIVVIPGYDGVYGVVKIWNQGDGQLTATGQEAKEEKNSQLGLF